MNLLILGGTKFLGHHLVQAAQQRGYRITLFHRGQTNPSIHSGVESIFGDRDGGLDALADRTWDAVIDTSGYFPRLVKASGRRLANQVGTYTFISSLSAYADLSVSGVNEANGLLALDDDAAEDISLHYGALKARCEQELEAAMPGRVLIIRPGLIVGPFDPSDRFTYWPVRIARGGNVLAPGQSEDPVQFIDVRDLAEWTVTMTEKGATGIFNASGPVRPVTMRQLLEHIRDLSGSDARFTWGDAGQLLELGVKAWIDMPLWLPENSEYAEYRGLNQSDFRKATAAGLTLRPLQDTVRAILAWHATRAGDIAWRAGLAPERERELLAALRDGCASA